MAVDAGKFDLLTSGVLHFLSSFQCLKTSELTLPTTIYICRYKLKKLHCNNFLLTFVDHSLGLFCLPEASVYYRKAISKPRREDLQICWMLAH
jgi:hypothetical protein